MRALAVLLLLLSVAAARAGTCGDGMERVAARDGCLIVKTFLHPGGGGDRVLYVLLHGNHSNGSPAVSMVPIAKELAERAPPGSVAVALIRPGYDDANGNYSTGSRDRADNWTASIIDDIADAIARLKALHKARRLVLIGHSGGSAVAGVILGRHPGLADAALLAGCVCDLRQWRAGRSNHPWSSESPSDYIGRIPRGTRITVLVGADDTVTPPNLSRPYAAELTRDGFAADLVVTPDRDHYNIIRSPRLIEMALALGRAS